MEEIGKARLPFVNGRMFAMYLQPEFRKLLNMTPDEFQKLRKKLSKEELENFKFRVFVDKDRIIICKGNVFQAIRPPGVDEELWKAFVASIIQEYGVDGAIHGMIAFFNEAIKRKVYTILEIFGLYVPIGKFDPSKLDESVLNRLPKDIRDYLSSDSFAKGAEKPGKNSNHDNTDASASKKPGN